MRSSEFIYWLNGFVTLSQDETIDLRQINIIQNHINLVRAVTGKVEGNIETFAVVLRELFRMNEAIMKKDFDLAYAECFRTSSVDIAND